MLGVFDRMNINNLASGLDALSVRNGVIAQNIANIDTPGYKAKDMKFQEVMNETLGKGKKLPMATTNEKHLPPAENVVNPSSFIYQQNNPSVRTDGNDVNMDYEMTQMAENSIRYNLVAELTTDRLTHLKYVITGK